MFHNFQLHFFIQRIENVCQFISNFLSQRSRNFRKNIFCYMHRAALYFRIRELFAKNFFKTRKTIHNPKLDNIFIQPSGVCVFR